MMNIDLDVGALSPHLTGIGRYTLELARGLPRLAEIERLRFCRAGDWVTDPEILLVAGGQGRGRQSYLKGVKKLVRNFRGQKKTLFHGPNFFLPAAVDGGIITIHDLSVFKFPASHPVERIRQFEAHFVRSVNQAAHIVTDSHATRREVIDFTGVPPGMVTAIHLGVDRAFRPRDEAECRMVLDHYGLQWGKYLLSVATFEPRKKIDTAIRAFADLPVEVKAAYPLLLAGAPGWKNEALLDLAKREQDAGFLRNLGYVPEEHLPIVYAGARAFVYPSVYEGFGLPPVEAMASGVPVIVSRHSCLPEVTGGAAILIEPDDHAAFRNSLLEVLQDETLREVAIQDGKRVAGAYCWKRCVAETAGVYAEVWRARSLVHPLVQAEPR